MITDDEDDGVISRWSKRKRGIAAEQEEAEPEADEEKQSQDGDDGDGEEEEVYEVDDEV